MGTVGREVVGERVDEIIDLLNQGIAAEINDAYRYLLLSTVASGVHSPAVAALFGQTAQDEWGHVALLMERVAQLGGDPLTSPSEAGQRSYVEYRPPPKDPADVRAMVMDSLAGERAAIRFYRDLFDRTRQVDPVTADLARRAMADEIDDEDELERLLAGWTGA
jgi:bacterioferritin